LSHTRKNPQESDIRKGVNVTQVSYGYATHEGAVRQVNEDHFCVLPDIGLFAVADGMGGHRGGRIASRVTVDQLLKYNQQGMDLVAAVQTIHHDIRKEAAGDPGLTGMGSTVVAMKIEDGRYEIVWVGDSRAYVWDGSLLKRLTRDHSYVQYLLDEGHITVRDIPDHPQRNIILQALGAEEMEEVAPDRVSGVLYQNEVILLCSDGLTAEIEENRIAEILSRGTPLQEAADRLVQAAIGAGGSDNITVILLADPNGPDPMNESLDDTDAFEIGGAATVIDDSEQTAIDATAPLEKGNQTQITEDRQNQNETSSGFNGLENRNAGGATSAVKGASPLKTVCIILAAMLAVLVIAIGLVRLP
jgi:PPM family protein phosphatase